MPLMLVCRNKLEDAQKQLAAAEDAVIASVKVPAAEEREGYGDDDKVVEGEAAETEKDEEEDEEEEEEADPVQAPAETEDDKVTSRQDAELNDLKSRVNFYQAAVQFVSTIHSAVIMIESLLRSKTTTDVVEAIDFLVAGGSAFPMPSIPPMTIKRRL